MEFKQPVRNRDMRPKLSVPQRGQSQPINPQPTQKQKTVSTSNIDRARDFFATKKVMAITLIGIVAIGSIAAGFLFQQLNIAKDASNGSDSNILVENLEYQTIVPDGKSISDLGGWKRVSPSGSEPVFAYTDTIGSISISVSQQPLPKNFVGNVDDQVSELAKKFSATNKIDAGDTKVYVGTSAKGPQSAIFSKNGLLVLIKSQEKIEDVAWAKYAKSLN